MIALTETSSLGDLEIKYTCEPCEGKYLDTKVEINGNQLCWITYSDIRQFSIDIDDVVSKYRI